MGEELDRRAAVDLVEHPRQRGFTGRLWLDKRVIHVSLPFSAPMGDVAFDLERSNHARDARIREITIYAIANLRYRCLAELPEHTHDVELALGEMQLCHCLKLVCGARCAETALRGRVGCRVLAVVHYWMRQGQRDDEYAECDY